MEKMRAAVVEELGKIVVKEVEKPKLTPDSLMVKVESCAICGSDLRIYKRGDKRAKLPQIIGHEIAGVVEEVGTEVSAFSAGDRVAIAPGHGCGKCYYCQRGIGNLCLNPIPSIGYASPGGFARYIVPPPTVVSQRFVNEIPNGLPFDEATIAELLACCLNGQEIVDVKEEDTIVIIGAGPAGCMHVEIAKARGARRIILAESSPARLEMAKRFRADIFVDSSSEDLSQRVLKETNNGGADVIIVACPSGEAQEESLQMIAPRGRISFFGGLPHQDSNITIDANIVHYKECFLTGASSSVGRQNKEALKLLSNGKIKARDFISHILPLEKIAEGFDLVERRQAIKVVIKPWE